MKDDCEFCGGPNKVTFKSDDEVGSVVRVCGKCEKKINAGKVLVDIFEFCWWKDKKGIHTAHVDDAEAPKGCRKRNMLWRKVSSMR